MTTRAPINRMTTQRPTGVQICRYALQPGLDTLDIPAGSRLLGVVFDLPDDTVPQEADLKERMRAAGGVVPYLFFLADFQFPNCKRHIVVAQDQVLLDPPQFPDAGTHWLTDQRQWGNAPLVASFNMGPDKNFFVFDFGESTF